MKYSNFIFLLLTIGMLACTSEEPTSNSLDPENLEKTLLEKLITAEDGEKIALPEGTFSFKRPLSLNGKKDITIEGAGMKKTVLSFKDQIEGAEGMIVKNVEGLTLKGFSVSDTKGDAIKVQGCKNVTMVDLETTWTGGALETNGGYGLYPVSCTNILMEKCEASYASDAGIYVGQSTNIVVRDNYAHHNVAGIEIENSINGTVYNNTAKENSGGLLIFDMPDLPQANGAKIKVFDNHIENNNHDNFAPQGTVVATLPPGSGITVMAHTEIEVYNNVIKNHKTVGLGILSWLFTARPFESENYDPFCSAISIHDNKFIENKGETDQSTDFGKLITALTQGQTVDIVMDGIYHPGSVNAEGIPSGEKGICLSNNGAVSFLNFNAGKGSEIEEMAQNMDIDMSLFDCSLQEFDVTGHDAWLASKD